MEEMKIPAVGEGFDSAGSLCSLEGKKKKKGKSIVCFWLIIKLTMINQLFISNTQH